MDFWIGLWRICLSVWLEKLHKFAIITDSNVEPLYARPLEQKLLDAGYQTDVFVFPAGEKSKTRQTKAMIEGCDAGKRLSP